MCYLSVHEDERVGTSQGRTLHYSSPTPTVRGHVVDTCMYIFTSRGADVRCEKRRIVYGTCRHVEALTAKGDGTPHSCRFERP